LPGNKVFVTYQTQGGFNSNPLRTPLVIFSFDLLSCHVVCYSMNKYSCVYTQTKID